MRDIEEFVKKKCEEQFKADFTRNILPEWNLDLSMILNALKKRFENDYHKMIFQDNKFFFICAKSPICQFYWEMFTDSGLKILFAAQSEQTQLAIAKLLGYEE